MRINKKSSRVKIKLIAIGKTADKNLQNLIETYQQRLKHYIQFQIEVIPDIKNSKKLSDNLVKEKEGQLLLKRISTSDHLILFDEKGTVFRSIEFSQFLQKKMNAGLKQIVLVIGGPYGFSPAVLERASEKISMSKMTFSHQMIRLFAVEQLYRAFTILKNEPYHHE